MSTVTGKRRLSFTAVKAMPTALDRAPEVERRAAAVRVEKDKSVRIKKALALVDFILTG